MSKEKDERIHTSSQLQSVNLPLCTEMLGMLYQLSSNDTRIHTKIDNKIFSRPKESIESEAASEKSHKGLIVRKSISYTDQPIEPSFVRR